LNELDRAAEKSARGSLYLFMGNFLSEIINAVGVVLVARLLTPEEYGVYSVAFVLPFLFVMFSNWGVGEALTRFLARYQGEGRWSMIRGIVRKGLAFNGGLSLLLTSIMYVSADFLAETILLRPGLGSLVRLSSVIVFLFSLFNTISAIYYGLERMDISAALIVVASLIRSAMSPLLVGMGYGVPGALIGYIVGYGAALLIGVILLARETRREDRSADLSGGGSLGEMLRFGFPLFLGGFVGGLGLRYQGLLQVWFASDLVIGNLNIATKFKSLAGLFTVPIAASIYPAFSKFRFEEKREEMTKMFAASVRYATMLVIPVTLLIMVVAEPIVVALFGREYALAPFFLAIIVLEFLPVGLGSMHGPHVAVRHHGAPGGDRGLGGAGERLQPLQDSEEIRVGIRPATDAPGRSVLRGGGGADLRGHGVCRPREPPRPCLRGLLHLPRPLHGPRPAHRGRDTAGHPDDKGDRQEGVQGLLLVGSVSRSRGAHHSALPEEHQMMCLTAR